MKERHIAIIPARSGSKGLKDKNIKPLHGVPMMAYTIEAALNSNLFDEIYVSTDSDDYASIAMQYGASVPFLRTSEFAQDLTSSWDVVSYTLAKYENEYNKTFTHVTLLQPTSPLRTSEDIVSCYELMTQKNADVVISVCESEHSPLLANTLPSDHSLLGFIDSSKIGPRQQLSTFYRINGAVYMLKTSTLEPSVSLYGKNSYAYIMPKERSVDIDDIYDFMVAETIITYNSKKTSVLP